MLDMILKALDRDEELRVLLLLEGRRICKEGQMVMLTRGYLRFVGVLDAILAEMRERGELRNDVHNDAVRAALTSMFEGMLRDQVLASRMGFPAGYDADEMRHIFRIVLRAFSAG